MPNQIIINEATFSLYLSLQVCVSTYEVIEEPKTGMNNMSRILVLYLSKCQVKLDNS